MVGKIPQVSFPDHVALLTEFLRQRHEIVGLIEKRLLNARAGAGPRSRTEVAGLLSSCFFLPGISADSKRLKGELEAAHVADGFEPVRLDAYANELDPVELVGRALRLWETRHRPGSSGRFTFAQSIYSVFMIRQLEYLSLRIWDDDDDGANRRLQQLQEVLARLNEETRSSALVRDVRWLTQTAQGPLTLHLLPYFRIAEQISASLSPEHALEVHKAGALLAGGHLRSQLHYRVWETHRSLDDPELTGFMRHSNSMDVALLIGDLVALLEAYQQACLDESRDVRLDLADAILQGLSADPELCLTRLDLLLPCTMIEHLFIEDGDDGRPQLSLQGQRHQRLIERYRALLGESAAALREDATCFDPSRHSYSPYGITYGFCADLMSNIAMSALAPHTGGALTLEDVFASRRELEHKLARADAWAALPVREGEQRHFDHSGDWARAVFARLTTALERRARRPHDLNASDMPDARVFVVPAGVSPDGLRETSLAQGVSHAPEDRETSDFKGTAPGTAMVRPKNHILSDRNEGRFLASAASDGQWFGISKLVLSLETGRGRDVLLSGVPATVIDVLRLTCAHFLVEPSAATRE